MARQLEASGISRAEFAELATSLRPVINAARERLRGGNSSN